MTEAEWLQGNSFYPLLEFLRKNHGIARTKGGKRRLRLFACACLRRIWHSLVEEAREIVEALERFCDGHEPPSTLKQLEGRALHLCLHNRGAGAWSGVLQDAVLAGLLVGNRPVRNVIMATSAALAISSHQVRLDRPGRSPEDDRLIADGSIFQETAYQLGIFHDIFGNPFRTPARRKFPAELRGLAQTCHEGDSSVLPMLIDALTDLGEEAAAAHLRQPVHVMGCHVVDWARGVA